MKISIISFSERGSVLSEKIDGFLRQQNCEVTQGVKGEFVSSTEKKVEVPLATWTQRAFSKEDALIFVGATGIAVRSIAPFLKGKDKDPAVLVIDETGRFVISLLSGHIGGANVLAEDIAQHIGGTAVVTTATDRNQKLAVDQWAVEQDLHIHNLSTAKVISAAILADLPVGFYSEVPVEGDLPHEIQYDESDIGIVITKEGEPYPQLFSRQLTLLPRNLVVGIGCRRGTPLEKIEEQVELAFVRAGRDPASATEVATIDLKKDEEGLIAFCKEKNLSMKTFSSQELLAVEGEFTSSAFVKSVTGVDNVCERAAILGGGGRLILKKTSGEGVTVAIGEKPFFVRFE